MIRSARNGPLFLAAILLLALPGPTGEHVRVAGTAAALHPAAPVSQAPVRADAVAAAGSIVHLDADGRPIVPPDTDVSAPSAPARAASRRIGPPPAIEPAPGGGDMVVLDGRLQHYTVIDRAADGSLAGACARQPEIPAVVSKAPHAPR